MRANVYVLGEHRNLGDRATMDVYMVHGTQADARADYEQIKGRPIRSSRETDVDGHSVTYLDEDDTGAAFISQYKIEIVETIEE